MTGLLLVVCFMMLAWRLQTHYHQSWSSNVKPGDRRVLPSGVENEQRLRRLIGRAHRAGAVVSLGLVSPGAATDGHLFFPLKNDDCF